MVEMCDVSAEFAAAAFGIHSARIRRAVHRSVIFFAADETDSVFELLSHSGRLLGTVLDAVAGSSAVEADHFV